MIAKVTGAMETGMKGLKENANCFWVCSLR
jgi:hypothetical protein